VQERIRKLNDLPIRNTGKYVLYRMRVNRRVESNHALAFAVALANRHGLPVLCYDQLLANYPYASDRFHAFLMEGIPETKKRLEQRGIGYVFHLGRRRSDASEFPRYTADAAAIVTDDWPLYTSQPCTPDAACFAVDSSCIVPMNCLEKREYAARTIRPKIHRLLEEYLKPVPRWKVMHRYPGSLQPLPDLDPSTCEIDHSVPPSIEFRGGRREAERRLRLFLTHNLRRYAKDKNEPSAHATSDLSPYLHFGYLSSLEVAIAVRDSLGADAWIAAEFLEQLIVRRELAFNLARFAPRLDSLDALPDWARQTLRKHASDRRDPVYSREQFEQARTHDALWNATQKEMLRRGKIHGYYRMYWGKKIIEWSATPKEALATLIHIHNRYALDGRDPNTYANILWCLGLHDQPFPERPIFGKVRYISLAGMRRKTDVDAYIREIDTIVG
jgi:deoxyribodipyrimidine photo-lyase